MTARKHLEVAGEVPAADFLQVVHGEARVGCLPAALSEACWPESVPALQVPVDPWVAGGVPLVVRLVDQLADGLVQRVDGLVQRVDGLA